MTYIVYACGIHEAYCWEHETEEDATKVALDLCKRHDITVYVCSAILTVERRAVIIRQGAQGSLIKTVIDLSGVTNCDTRPSK